MFPVFLTRASFLAFVASASRRSGGSMASISSTTSLQSAAGEPVKRYILRYNYSSDVLEKRGPYREQHLDLARRSCISGGPTASTVEPDQPTGALFIFETRLAAASFMDNDPYVQAGIVTGAGIEEWTVAIQN